MTKYELCSCQFQGAVESMIPVKPANRNCARKAVQKSIGVAKRILPPHMVAIQLKILIPVGTPTNSVESTKNAFCAEVMPTLNIWWAQTLRLIKPMPADAATMAG